MTPIFSEENMKWIIRMSFPAASFGSSSTSNLVIEVEAPTLEETIERAHQELKELLILVRDPI